MNVKLETIELQTKADKELIDVTDEVERIAAESGIKNGLVFVMTMHTSSGIIVTEGLECLEMDVLANLENLAPDQGDYYHNRYLDIDGRIAYNAGSHLKSIIGGYNALFPVRDGGIVKGSRQRIYFAEFDGPLARNYIVQVMGE